MYIKDLAMELCKSKAFRSFLHYVSPHAALAFPSSPSTIRSDIKTAYDMRRSLVVKVLKNAMSSIHVSPDGWTSPNGLGLLDFNCHLMGADKEQHQFVLGLDEVKGLMMDQILE